MLVVGLTGGIGCGKSTVADLFATLGVPVIDTDLIARELVEPGQPALKLIIDAFGTDILNNDQTLNRRKLAQICFADEKHRQQLEAILHPAITQTMQARLNQLNSNYAIVVIPLLFEANQQQLVDRILLVDCPEDQQIERVQQRDQRSPEEIQAIISAQYPPDKKREAADDILINDSDIINLEPKIRELHEKYLNLSQL